LRLQRLARYEVEITAAVLEDVYVPLLPIPDKEIDDLMRREQKTRDEQLREVRRDVRSARQEVSKIILARDLYITLGTNETRETVTYEVGGRPSLKLPANTRRLLRI
jgi:hypothetical protein